MADETEVSQEQVAEATSLGWAPKEKWKGAPEKWVDADQFLSRGMGIHHLRDKNTRLENQLQLTTNELDGIKTSLQAANAAIEALEESRAEDVKEQVDAARTELKAQLETASRDGDHKGVADLTDKLVQLNTADAAAGDKGDKGDKGDTKQVKPVVHPEVVQWYKDNPDFANPRKNALATAIGMEMRAAGDTSVGKVFLDKIAAEVDKMLGAPGGQRRDSKVEAGNGGGGRGGDNGGGATKTYADLPAEAKAACDKMAGRLVGANRAHKDVASWRASYTKQFFGDQT